MLCKKEVQEIFGINASKLDVRFFERHDYKRVAYRLFIERGVRKFRKKQKKLLIKKLKNKLGGNHKVIGIVKDIDFRDMDKFVDNKDTEGIYDQAFREHEVYVQAHDCIRKGLNNQKVRMLIEKIKREVN